MVDISSLDKSLVTLVEKRMELSQLSYDNKKYDEIEEELHDLEDDFVEEYGDFMEEVLETVHSLHCSDTDVLLPIAYLAKKYFRNGLNEDSSPAYGVDYNEGVLVDADKFPGKEAHLVIIPSPVRIHLMVGQKYEQEVWRASLSHHA
jgi:hypothetical protein